MPGLRWGILGLGGIARTFFAGTIGSDSGRVVAVATRFPPDAGTLGAFGDARFHLGYDALLADADVDAVYIATPHPFHFDLSIRALRAGKHVLCEKPIGMNAAQTSEMFAAAHEARLFLGEAYMYRHHPLTKAILQVVSSGRLGVVRLVKSSFGFALPEPNPEHRLLSPALGGGAILDIGGYPVSMALLIARSEGGGDEVGPVTVQGDGVLGQTGVDEYSSALLRFRRGLLAEVSCSIAFYQDNVLHVVGDRGRLEVDDFWFGTGTGGGEKTIRVYDPSGTCERIAVQDHRHLYSFEFEAANTAIQRGLDRFEVPGMDEKDSVSTARILDAWLADVHGSAKPPALRNP